MSKQTNKSSSRDLEGYCFLQSNEVETHIVSLRSVSGAPDRSSHHTLCFILPSWSYVCLVGSLSDLSKESFEAKAMAGSSWSWHRPWGIIVLHNVNE